MADTNKTEKATTKKRHDERKKGNVFKSKDVVSVVSLFVGFFLAIKLGGYMSARVRELYLYIMNTAGSIESLSVGETGEIGRQVVVSVFTAMAPILVAMFLVAIVAHGVQTRFLVAADLIKFKFNRINPIEGIKRLFSVRSLVELLKSVIKIAVIIWLVFSTVMNLLNVAPDILNTQMDVSLVFMLDEIMRMVCVVCLIFVGVAALDFFYQRYDYEKRLRMSKQEVKDEFKQMEGDPLIKGKRREQQREISMNRMMQQIPQADVVVRNPTHFAVALKYDIDSDPAPIVLAKGQDHVARRIISLAEQNGVLITENPPLARSLYGAVKVNEYIPPGLYNAVAEVMAWVYGQQKRSIAPAASGAGK